MQLQIAGIRSSTGHSHNFLTDGSADSLWVHNGAISWIELELVHPQQVGSMKVAWGFGDRLHYNFSVFVSPDQQNWWRAYGPIPSSGLTQTINLGQSPSSTQTKFVKLEVYDNDSLDNNEKTRKAIGEIELLAGTVATATVARGKLTAKMTTPTSAPISSVVVLDGTRSTGSIKTYTFSQVSGPKIMGGFTPTNPSGSVVQFTAPPTAGDIEVMLTVKTASGKSKRDIDKIKLTGTPTCPVGQHWDAAAGVCVPDTPPTPCPPGFHDDGAGNCVPDPIPTGAAYDSNRDGKWDNGVKRTITGKEGNTGPDGLGLYTAASGNPHLVVDGNGTAHLFSSRFGRIYICAKNYSSVLEMDFNIENTAVDNLSLKLRSRHQEGGAGPNRGGGEGWAISLKDWDSKRENFHNEHSPLGSKKLSQTLKIGTWYKLRFTCKDAGANKIQLIGEIDYGQGFVKEMDLIDSGAPSYFFDKVLLQKNSYFWIRCNASGNASVGLKNVRLTRLP